MPSLVIKGRELPTGLGKHGIMPEPETLYKVSIEAVASSSVSEQTEQNQPRKGKWAMVADQMAEENFLDGDLGEKVDANVQTFRENCCL